jgi:hypothetical protein
VADAAGASARDGADRSDTVMRVAGGRSHARRADERRPRPRWPSPRVAARGTCIREAATTHGAPQPGRDERRRPSVACRTCDPTVAGRRRAGAAIPACAGAGPTRRCPRTDRASYAGPARTAGAATPRRTRRRPGQPCAAIAAARGPGDLRTLPAGAARRPPPRRPPR